MITVLSPSKSMDMEPAKVKTFSEPLFLDRSQKLVSKARKFSAAELMDFMDISEKLAELNHRRFKDWKPPFSLDNAKQAVLAFTGDVYDGLDAPSLKKTELNYAQNHLRILSGLYGLLKPLDLIQPYRLEMGRPLETRGAKNLYEFWKAAVTEELNRTPGDVLVNLASNEYFKAIDKKALDKDIISPVFKDEKNGTYKIISFYAKKARGAMARFLIENRAKCAADLLEFKEDGYFYNAALSKPGAPVFTRPEA
ncbi:peroxide stress protein YaaA [Pontiella sp.]|uniref:peroxide stress protein YaaA n=1 Tax=Pontiella sp. TaxID=2837462 RepID=UPI00356265E8